ncbi:peroxiredoxin-like family protein [Mucilaginibacter jinjuensis]|uniref:thioredoxin-dependent peroxiredoxin n=1 Tax=Mucilaginibacter jinjuensis TaxID=1176721 RepID=A0ABY7TD42_9SPHI|nr:peroxiredoxin-like family protein [Mucilaginibacter jinjuensis]WCT14268.1 peroxiredoxin-like family protein [Mucilaginibacter jinjuensis]
MKINLNKFLFCAIFPVALLTFPCKAEVVANPATDTVMAKAMIPAKPTDVSPLLIGESIPAVVVPDAGGKSYNLNEKINERPTILVFYRGGWCPFCNKELAGLQAIQGDLVKMGYQIIAISTDSPDNLKKSIGKHQLTYTLLSDADLNVSKQFGIAFKAPAAYSSTLETGSNGKNVDKLLPVPSVFILNKKGVIQFEYINPDFKQRIGPDLLQAVSAALVKENATKENGK